MTTSNWRGYYCKRQVSGPLLYVRGRRGVTMCLGFLDIDKNVESRKQPDEKASRQPAIPQRKSTASQVNAHSLPVADIYRGISVY